MKIETIKISNLKAVVEGELSLKGCTAIITGPNDSGKTTLLKSLPDRIRFVRPDVIVTNGRTEGSGTLTLTSGERFVWEYNVDGKDKLTYFTAEGLKSPVTKELGRRFFPATFDIGKFLQSSPKDQAKQLQAIIGLDFTDIDRRYDLAYKERTLRNSESERYHVKLSAMLKVPEVKSVDLSELTAKKEAERIRLNSLYLENKASNEKIRQNYQSECRKIIDNWKIEESIKEDDIYEYNSLQAKAEENIRQANNFLKRIKSELSYNDELAAFVDLSPLELHIATMPQPGEEKSYIPSKQPVLPEEPKYIEEMPDDSILRSIDAEILQASETNAKASAYGDYVAYQRQVDEAKFFAEEANYNVLNIEQERRDLIATANMPAGIEIRPDGVYVDSLPLSKDQISTSKLYITALRIGSINLGSVRTLYFDASYLDNKNLSEVERWAESEGLQLLIERPSLDGGEIAYELIETI